MARLAGAFLRSPIGDAAGILGHRLKALDGHRISDCGRFVHLNSLSCFCNTAQRSLDRQVYNAVFLCASLDTRLSITEIESAD